MTLCIYVEIEITDELQNLGCAKVTAWEYERENKKKKSHIFYIYKHINSNSLQNVFFSTALIQNFSSVLVLTIDYNS